MKLPALPDRFSLGHAGVPQQHSLETDEKCKAGTKAAVEQNPSAAAP